MTNYGLLLYAFLQPLESVMGKKKVKQYYNRLCNSYYSVYSDKEVKEVIVPNIFKLLDSKIENN